MGVSIPIGFSSSLQHGKLFLHVTTEFGFNPYRVFKFAATLGDEFAVSDGETVSIPIGFSSSLQQQATRIQELENIGFNPYRVFKFAATRWSSIIQSTGT